MPDIFDQAAVAAAPQGASTPASSGGDIFDQAAVAAQPAAKPAPTAVRPDALDAFYAQRRSDINAAPVRADIFARSGPAAAVAPPAPRSAADAALEQSNGPDLSLQPNAPAPTTIGQQIRQMGSGSRIAPTSAAPISQPSTRVGGERVQTANDKLQTAQPILDQAVQQAGKAADTVLSDPAKQGLSGLSDLGEQIGEDYSKQKTIQGLTKAIAGGGTVAMIVGAPEVGAIGQAALGGDVAAKVAMAKIVASVTAGAGASAAGGAVASKLNLSPDAQELVKTTSFFLPSLLGAGMGIAGFKGGIGADAEGNLGVGVETPGGTKVGGRVANGGVEVGVKRPDDPFATTVRVGRQEPLPPSPTQIQAGQQEQGTVETAIKAATIQKAAQDKVAGVPPPQPPKPPMPTGMDKAQLLPRTVALAAEVIKSLPPEQQAQGIMESHARLADWMLEQGKFIGPDGKLQIVDTPQKAQKLAQDVMNDEVDRQTSAAEEKRQQAEDAQKEQQKQVETQHKEAEKAAETPNENGLIPAEQQQARVKTILDSAQQLNGKELTRNQQIDRISSRMGVSRVTAIGLLDQHLQAQQPTVGAGAHETVEESKATIDKQIDALKAGTVHTVMLPEGSKYMPVTPPGAKVVKVTGDVPGAGTYITTLKPATVKEAAKAGTHGDLLGHVVPKEELISKGEPTAVVQAVDPKDGVPIQDSEVPRNLETVGRQASILHEQHPEAHIRVTTPEQVLQERQQAAVAEAEPEQDIFDQAEKSVPPSKPVEPKFTKINPDSRDELMKEMVDAPGGWKSYDFEWGKVLYDPSTEQAVSFGRTGDDEEITRQAADKWAEENPLKEVAPKPNEKEEGSGKINEPEAAVAEQSKAAVAEKEHKYEFGNTQHNIDKASPAHAAIDAVRSKISDADLMGDGKDIDDNHVTVRYGIQGEDTAGIREYLRKQSPFEAKLGAVTSFPPSKNSDGAAPLIASVESPELHRMNAEIEKAGDFKESFFKEYKPHATIAYVKPDAVNKYVGDKSTVGKTFRVDSVEISDRDGKLETVKFEGKEAEKAIAKGDQVDFADRAGKERTGTVVHIGDRIVRIKSDGKEYTVPAKQVARSTEITENTRLVATDKITGEKTTIVENGRAQKEQPRGPFKLVPAKEGDVAKGSSPEGVSMIEDANGIKWAIGDTEKMQAKADKWNAEGNTYSTSNDVAKPELKKAPGLGLSVIDKPNGKFGYVGAVPAELNGKAFETEAEAVQAAADAGWLANTPKRPEGALIVHEPRTGKTISIPETKPAIAKLFLEDGDNERYDAAVRNLEAKDGGAVPDFKELQAAWQKHMLDPNRDAMSLKDFARSMAHATGSFAGNNVANQTAKAENQANEPASQPEPTAEGNAGDGRASAVAESGDRGEVAEVAPGLRDATPSAEQAEVGNRRDRLTVREASAAISVEGAGSGSGPGSDTGIDSSPAGVTIEKANKELVKPAAKLNRNWYSHPDNWNPPTGTIGRLDGNLKALRILRDIEKNPRPATEDEKEALANYVGWGALSNVFDPTRLYGRPEYRRMIDANQELSKLLSPDEMAAARRSTQNAHYTSPELVRFMWDVMKRFGFTGGNILEPSMGTGNFFGMMPKAMRNNVSAFGNELEPITAGIARILYPDATITNKDFVEFIMPDNSLALAISNVPFGVSIHDPKYPKLNAKIHDYFFVKALDKVKPGGMVAFITSTGTMDKKSSNIRDILASKSNLIGAIRLPSGAFEKNAGTSVTTDLILLQKRSPGEQPSGADWSKVSEITVPGRPGYGPQKVGLNEYFQKSPEMMLGKPGVSEMYGRDGGFALYPHEDQKIADLLEKAKGNLPKGIMREGDKASGLDQASTPAVLAKNNQLEGQYVTDDKGNLKQVVDGRLERPKAVEGVDGSVSVAKVQRIKAQIEVRDKLNDLLATMMEQSDDEHGNAVVARQRASLSKEYDKFVKKYGMLNASANRIFEDDPHYPRLLALENWDREKKEGTPADILTKRTVFPRESLTSVSSNPEDALYQILAERGYPDVNLMAKLQGLEPAQVAKTLLDKGLVYRDPSSGDYETKEKYLSGYVRDKLDMAKAAVAQGLKEYEKNVTALEKAVPKDVPIKDIEVKLGATWIPLPAFTDFIEDVFKVRGAKITYVGGAWDVPSMPSNAEVSAEYGGGMMHADELMQLALNQKEAVVKTKDPFTGNEIVDPARTLAARQAQQKIRDAFNDWAGKSEKWAKPLEKAYNYAFNNIVTPEYDGSHLTFPGMNADVNLRPHQRNVIWRIIQDGRALVDHAVGAGKTYAAAAAIMEGRRTGTFRKPMLAVPNHLVEQWRKEFLHLYPAANLLVPTEQDFDSKNRQRLMAKIATGDYDAVILAHSQFNRMDISAERQAITIGHHLDELEEAILAQKSTRNGGDRRTVKQLEKERDAFKTRLDKLKGRDKDKVINFDDTGVDALFVDEAHEYKNLAFKTKMTRIAGLSQGDAQRALALEMKTNYLLDTHNNRGVVFMTGTPVQNTMAEQYTMTKYVAPDVLQKAGIKYFDDWAANFGSVRTINEMSADGRSYKSRNKFSRFTNVPELMKMYRSFTDTKTAADLNLPTPPLEGGKPMAMLVEASDLVNDYVNELVKRAENVKNVDPSEDNMLKITGDGRKAATDMRLIDPDAEDDPDSKINQVVDDVYREWKDGKEQKLTQLVFLDQYRSIGREHTYDAEGNIASTKEYEKLNLYHDMREKWVARGIPEDQIAIIGDYDTKEKRQRLFDQVKRGDVRILMGSTQKMGAGMNVQRLLKVLHHVDLPWRPGDLEQRNGRIERQGNMNDSIRIKNWLTKGSFDTYMLQALEGKAAFIAQLKAGNFEGRTMEDIGNDMTLNLQEMKVATSGNPDVKLKFDLEMEKAQLVMLDRQHDSQRRDNMYRAQSLRSGAAREEGIMLAMDRARAKMEGVKGKDGEGFSMEVDGQKFTDRKTAFEHLEAMEVPAGNFFMSMNGVGVAVNTFDERAQAKELSYQFEYGENHIDVPSKKMDSMGRSIESRLNHLKKNIEDYRQDIISDRQKADKLDALAKEASPQRAKIEEVNKKLKEIDQRLGIGGPVKDQVEQQLATESPDDDNNDGDDDGGGSDNKPVKRSSSSAVSKGGLRSSLGGVDLLAEFLADQGAKFYKSDIEPSLVKLAPTVSKGVKQITDLLYPRIGANQDALDSLMIAKGDREEHRVMLENIDGNLAKFFDKMGKEANIAFMDRAKMGIDQLGKNNPMTQRLQEIRMLQEHLGQQSTARMLEYKPTMALKDHYYGMIWDKNKLPDPTGKHAATNAAKAAGTFTGQGKRPFEGAKGFMKRSTLENITEGINAGGEPVTYNAWKMFALVEAQKMQYITAQDHWKRLKSLGLRKFVKHGERAPEGWSPLNDRIAKIFFPATSGEGRVHAGDWYLEHSAATLLNNYLSRDLVRENVVGHALMTAKMLSTALELSLSPFHLIFESLEAMGSQLGLGIQRSWNTGVREGNAGEMAQGAKEAASFMAAPFMMARQGGSLLKMIQNPKDFAGTKRGIAFLKKFPDAPAMMADLYHGGLTWGMNEDYKASPLKSLREAASEGNYVGVMMRALPALNDTIMHPLFGVLIPRLKWGLAMAQYAQQLAEDREAVLNGDKTREEIARQVTDTVENRLGEMNFDNIFWNNSFKSIMQLIFRSVTWKLGNWRGFATAAGPEAYHAFVDPLKAMYEDVLSGSKTHDTKDYIPRMGPNQAWLAGMAALTVVLGTIVGKMLTNKLPQDHIKEDEREGYSMPGAILLEAIHPRTGKVNKRTGKPERISLPTGMKDFEHAAHSPRNYVNSSLSSTVGRFLDITENRDFFGNYVYDPNATFYKKAAEVFSYAVPKPIGLENWNSEFGSQDVGSKALRFSGFNASSSQGLDDTAAEEHMTELARAAHTPETPDQVKEYRERSNNEKPTIAQMRNTLKHGSREHVEEQFNHLTYAQARDVFYNYATPREKVILKDMLQAKRSRALRKDAKQGTDKVAEADATR